MSVEPSPRGDATIRAPAPSRRPGPSRARLLGTLCGIAAAVLVGLLVVSLLPRAGSGDPGGAIVQGDQLQDGATDDGAAIAGAPAWERPLVDAAALADRIGVRITHVAVTGGGGLLDLRVQVLDPDKAAALHDPANPSALVDATTGIVASSLLMGHSHSDPFKAGVTYYYVFENPGNVIRRGGTVSVLLGDTEIDDVPVQ